MTSHLSLGAPELRAKATYSEVQTTTNDPFAAFTFYYRSECKFPNNELFTYNNLATNIFFPASLKSLGIIPRTPSPSPEPEPEEKDLNKMTPEEMRAELQRMRVCDDTLFFDLPLIQQIGTTTASEAKARGQRRNSRGRRRSRVAWHAAF